MKRTFIKKGIFTFLAIFSAVASYAQTAITTGVFSPLSVCVGGTVSVPFSTTGTVAGGTVFTVQLSDASGSFAAPVGVGTGTTSPLTATIGVATAAGTGYKLRVITTTPAVIGTAGSGSLTILNPGVPTITTPVSYVRGATATALTATGATGATFAWYVDASTLTALPAAPVPVTTTVGTEDYFVSQTVGGCEGSRAKIDVNITATPTPTATPAGPYCKDVTGVPALTATPSGGGTLKWYDSGNTLLGAAPTPLTTTVGNTTYYVSQVINGFESAKVSIIVEVVAPPGLPVTAPISFCKGDAGTALTATGEAGATFKWYTDPVTGTGVSPFTPPTTTVGPVTYYVSQTKGCESARASLIVTIKDVSAEPVLTSPTSHCASTTPAAALTATGTGIKWYSSANVLLGSAPTPDVNVGATTAYNYFVTQTEAGKCESSKKAVTINVYKTVAPTVGSGSVTYCLNDTPAALTATGTALIWYADATTGTALSGAALTPSTAAAGSVDYYVTQTLNGCESARVKFTVIVKARPAAPTVVAPADVCQNTTVASTVLSGAVTGTALLWYDGLTGGSGSASAPTPNTSANGTNDYYVTQTVDGCESTPRTKVSLVVKPATPLPGVTPKSYCLGETAVAITGVGTALKFYFPDGSPSPTAPVPQTTVVMDAYYNVTQTLNGCESPKAPLLISIKPLSAAPTFVAPSYCTNETSVALTATGTNLKWYADATTTTALSGAALTPSTATVGTVDYYVTQTANGCESLRVKYTVTTKVRPAAPVVVNPADVCQNIPVLASVLSAAVTGTSVLWYSDLTGGTGGAAPTPLTTTSGTKDYYVTQTNVAGCESSPRTKVSLVVKPAPALPTVTALDYCKDATAVALTAVGTSVKYYTLSTGGVGATVAPVPLTTTVGDVTYYVTQTNAQSCESLRAPLVVTTNPLPALATVASIDPICQENPGKNYSFSATGTAGNTFNWYTAATAGTLASGTPSVNSATVGETTYYAVQVTNKGCESPTRVAQKIRIKKMPGAPSVTSLIEYCQFAGASPLTATSEAGASTNWWGTSSTGGNSSGTPPPISTEQGGTTSFYVSQTLEACESSRAKIDVLIKTTPKPSTTTSLGFCQGATGPTLSATGTNLKWYRESNSSTSQPNAFVVFTEKVGDYSFFVTQTGSNGCESPKEEIKIHIRSLPSATISGNSSIALGENANIKLDFTGDGPWSYTLSSGNSGTANNSSVNVTVAPATTTTYVVTKVSNDCGSGIPLGSAVVTVRVPTISTGNPSSAEACAGKTVQVPFQQSGTFPDGNKFVVQISKTNEDAKFKEIPSVATTSQITATLPDTLSGGVYFVRIVSAGTNADFLVKGSVAGITLIVNALPAATISGSKTILAGQTADLKIDFLGKAPWTFNLNNGTKDSSITATTSPYNFILRPKATTTYTLNSIVNACGTVAKGNGSARIQVDPILGLEPASVVFAKVYPTLVDGRCTIELDEAVSSKKAGIELINTNGQTMLDKKIKQKITEVDLSTYPGGLYLLRVTNGNHSSIHRIIRK